MKFKKLSALLCAAAMLASVAFTGCGILQFKKEEEEGQNTEDTGNGGNTPSPDGPSGTENPNGESSGGESPSGTDNEGNSGEEGGEPADEPDNNLLTTKYIAEHGASTYGYDWLATQTNGANLQAFYRAIDEKCAEVWACTAQFTKETDGNRNVYDSIGRVYSTKLSTAEVGSVYRVYTYDHPYAYWLRGACLFGRSNVQGSFVCVLTEDGFDTLQKIDAVRAEVNANISAMYKKAEGLTDPYDISLLYYKQLAYSVDYSMYEENGSYYASQENWAHSIQGVFDNDKSTNPVCEGYAKSYQLLLNLSGVENVYCIGYATSDGTGGGGGHAWNMLKLKDGNWYYCDVTWDDGNNSNDYSFGTADSYYFAVSSTQNIRGQGKTFPQMHINGDPSGSNGYYLYDLPAASSTPYECDFPVNGTYETEDFTFRRSGVNTVSVCKIKAGGTRCTIPATVTVGEREYAVTEIDSRSPESTVVQPVLDSGSRITQIYLTTNIKAIRFGAFSATKSYRLYYSGTDLQWQSVYLEKESFRVTPVVYFI